MNSHAAHLTGPWTDVNDDLEREFEERLIESSTLAFRVAYAVLRHRQDAEDVAQEAFTKAHRSFRQLRDRDRFRAWLVKLTWRLAIDWQRNNRRRLQRDTDHGPAIQAIGNGRHPDPARADDIWRAIDRLPEKLRVVLVLASIEGHEMRDVAALLRVPEGTVKSRLFLARRRLKEHLS